MTRRAAVLGMAALAVGALALTLWRAQQPIAVELAHPQVEPERWVAYAHRVKARPPRQDAVARQVLDAYIAANRAELTAAAAKTDPLDDPTARKAAQALQEAQLRFDQAWGAAELVQLGRWQGLYLVEHVERALAQAQRVGQPLAAWVVANPQDSAARAAGDVAGGLLAHLDGAGFIRDGALDPTRLPLLQAVFMHHWIGPVRRLRPLEAHLWADEVEWLMRWRLEFHRQGRLAERLAAADALRTVARYPADLNAGVLLYQAGRFREALERFERSDARRAPAYRRAARAELR
ncbi:MAG: hypothetical protein KC613_07315 [Myxococcales bacterium]|nr:hypothetical protein [Myxococcales bacterium]MCB9521903.1 hypothetical protein [Myxococcales bacterium]